MSTSRFRKLFFIIVFIFLGNNLYSLDLVLNEEEKIYLKNKKYLKIAHLNDFPPFGFTKYNEAKGYSVEYIRLLSQKLGLKPKFILNYSWSQYLDMLKTNSIDVIPYIAVTPKRKEYIDFTSFDYISYNTGFLLKKSMNITEMKDLENKKLALTRGTFLHDYLKKNFPLIHLILTTSTKKAVEAVSLGKADVAIGSMPSLSYYMENSWLSNLKLVNASDFSLPNNTALKMGVKKDNILKNILEKAQKEVGYTKLQNLKLKWMNVNKEKEKKEFFTEKERQFLTNKQRINFCIDPDWMPYEKIDNNKHIGMSSDYIKLIQERLPIPLKLIKTSSWSNSLEYAKKRRCDMFPLIMDTKERSKYLNFSEVLLEVPLIIATRFNQGFINKITDIPKEKIGITRNYAYAKILKEKYPFLELIEVSSVEDGLEKVKDGEIFGYIGSLYSVAYVIQNKYIENLKISGKFDEKWKLSVGSRNDETLLNDIFNKIIADISQKNKTAIKNKWISVNYQNAVDYTMITQLSVVFLIILSSIFYKNRSVKSINEKLTLANMEIKDKQEMVDKYVLILNTDLRGNITHLNKAYSLCLGYKERELLGKNHVLIKHESTTREFTIKMWNTLREGKSFIGEIKNYTKDKQIKEFTIYIEAIYNNKVKIGYRSICQDITDKKRLEALSLKDKLTGLYNRNKFDELMILKIEEFNRYQVDFSIIMIDIDNFKCVNDEYGHDVGDKVLVHIAKILKDNVRISDIVARWGGEEFIIVCEHTNTTKSYIVAENIRKIIEKEHFEEVENQTISLGLSQFTKEDSINSIFKRVDAALYKAKNEGKNKTIIA
ncbi:MAG: hypothetical protein COA66_08575 [Arcobacter sp.]|nr:MAG: hypothetical protein COA66_08575 [Arcobacter sp.]